jgi:biotin carboxyl carrier protein
VGIFYTHSSALEKPLVKAGDPVKKGQTVGHIVSMGISHNLVSGVDGRVLNQRVRHKEPVEYGEVIFELERE